MKSEDIARYVASLEEEHESASRALAREVDTAYAWQRRAETAEAEVERLRAALPVLPDELRAEVYKDGWDAGYRYARELPSA